ncbi:MAG TPA: ATP-binding protein [Candidatus Syntrophoarchaeum butanivorans]|uniref:ATP-binding protein n=1 Tax=Candidatus Syntropharchaeum butanivorans TaxID=1839936 RepID=A0A1F2P6K6_9EURY|nr:MAG: ATP-binding protein [Candidatus Syntrophoarchaeum butanivorans]HEC57886.1 ATP-binding protein [Candidatus Syntrophoarchaeum butanivorans]
MGYVIAVSGKGGTGKTLISALLIRHFSRKCPVLAIDADPDSNLPDVLGVEVERTIGDVRESLTGEEVREFEGRIHEILVEERDFDLLVMGRPEQEGCYCVVNNILRVAIDSLAKNYDITIIDCEAGLEHLSRRTTRNVDIMLVVTDATKKGILTAKRIKEIANNLHIKFKRIFVVVNRITPELQEQMEVSLREEGLDVIGFIPFDQIVAEYDLMGRTVFEFPDDTPVVRAFDGVVKRIEEELSGL